MAAKKNTWTPERRAAASEAAKARLAPQPVINAPLPESAAATRPAGSFYDPKGQAAGQSALSAAIPPRPAPRAIEPEHTPEEAAEIWDEVDKDVLHAGPEDEETVEEAIARIRSLTTRRMGGFQQKLAYPKRPGYYRHWFNDSPGRIDEAKANGWAFVKGQDGQPVRRHVDSGRDNRGLNAYIMQIPELIHREDMAARHAAAASMMESVKRKAFDAQPGAAKPSDAGKFYSPTQADPITISESVHREPPR